METVRWCAGGKECGVVPVPGRTVSSACDGSSAHHGCIDGDVHGCVRLRSAQRTAGAKSFYIDGDFKAATGTEDNRAATDAGTGAKQELWSRLMDELRIRHSFTCLGDEVQQVKTTHKTQWPAFYLFAICFKHNSY